MDDTTRETGSSPRISVCVPTYNGAAFLAQTLHSISAQTFHDYEVVVVDDGSSDDTLAIARSYAAQDRRVRVFHNEERAGSSARNANRCLDRARGEWIKFLFQDDVMAPACLERMLQASASGKFVVCWRDFAFEADLDVDVRREHEEHPSLKMMFESTYVSPEEFCQAILRRWNVNFIGPTSSSLVHRTCFDLYGRFSSEIVTMPALECWIRLGSHEGLAIVPETLVTFRVHGASITSRIHRDPRLQYRTRLERLLLLVNLAKAPEYDSVRTCAWSLQPPLDPDATLRQAAEYERWLAVDTRYRRRDSTTLDEWKSFCRAHPEIREALRQVDAERPLLGKLKLRVKSWL